MVEKKTSREHGPGMRADSGGSSKKSVAWGKKAVVVLAVAVSLIVAGLVLGLQSYHGDPWRPFCVDSVDDLPAEIPERVVIDTVTEARARFVGVVRLTVEGVLRGALAAYSFSGRLIPQFEENQTDVRLGDHRMELRVYLREGVFAEDGWGFVPGRMCGNIVFVQLLDDLDNSRLVFIHEIGHFFGLYHELATYMGHPLCPETHRAEFSARQVEILNRWNSPGTPYVRHWDQMKADGKKSFGCPDRFTPVIVVSLGLVAAAVFLFDRKRRKRPLASRR